MGKESTVRSFTELLQLSPERFRKTMENQRGNKQLCVLLILIASFWPVTSLVPSEIVFVLLSQGSSPYTRMQADLAMKHLLEQLTDTEQTLPAVYMTHQDFHHPGAWTVLPIIEKLHLHHGTNTSWIVFFESQTRFNLTRLLDQLAQHDEMQELWLGHAVHDREAIIIHHFAFADNPQRFKYPHFPCGFAISRALLNRLSVRLVPENVQKMDFSIDAAHELALFVWDKGKGPPLTPSRSLCLHNQLHCASYIERPKVCGDPISRKSVYFAVKTCMKFHKERVPVVKSTWARHTVHLGFFSEADDVEIPTINVGVPNTEHGHCGKTMAIMKHVAAIFANVTDIKWVVLVDDDTILSVGRLQQLLSCFDGLQPLALGERYGYQLLRSSQGYNYLTGGAGMVLSRDVVVKIASSQHCHCPSPSSPDDMFLGVCLARLGIPITHSSLFHQARPVDYPPEYLAMQSPVSFHKHWMLDPLKVYDDWFSSADIELTSSKHKHSEL